MMDHANMPSRPIQISVDEELLQRIDADPEVLEHGRSAFIRAAVRLYLRARERRAVDDAIRSAYAGEADDLLGEIEGLVGGQSWPAE